MKLSITLNRKIIDYLVLIPDIRTHDRQQALLREANLDSSLLNQIGYHDIPAHFMPVLLLTLSSYGRLQDGRNAVEAVLEASKHFLAEERHAECDALIQEVRTAGEREAEEQLRESRRRGECESCGRPLQWWDKLFRHTLCKSCR